MAVRFCFVFLLLLFCLFVFFLLFVCLFGGFLGFFFVVVVVVLFWFFFLHVRRALQYAPWSFGLFGNLPGILGVCPVSQGGTTVCF